MKANLDGRRVAMLVAEDWTMGLVTSREPADLSAFNRKMLEEISEGRHDSARGARKGKQGDFAEAV